MSNSNDANQGFTTRAIHHAYDPYSGYGALNPPLYLSSTYTFPTVEDGAARFAGEQEGFVYSRVGNPTTALLEARIANLEGGEAALVTASGQPQRIGRVPAGELAGASSSAASGMTSHSLVPKAAKAVGIGFEELCWRILETSLAREQAAGCREPRWP